MNILVIRRDNIGDLVCTTPLFEALRQQFPQAYIAALVNSYNEPVIQDNPYLDDVFSYTKGKHAAGEPVWRAHLRRLRLFWQLRRQHFDYAILANSGFMPRLLRLARQLSPKHVIGFVPETAAPSLIDHPVRLDSSGTLHETEDLFRLLAPLGISGNIPRQTVMPDEATAQRIRAVLPTALVAGAGPLIALQISSRKEKQRWPVECYAEFARRLHAQQPARFLVFWSPGDENNPFHPGDDGKARRLLDLLDGLPVAPVRTEHLSELIAGLSLCDIGVMSDGGAMHVAAGLGKPLLCFFGNSSAARWHPWSVDYELLQPLSRTVSDIAVDEALTAFMRLLGRR